MADNPELVLTKGPQAGRRFSLDEPSVVLGRDPRNAVVIDHPQVSRRHARIVRRGDAWVIDDMESTNGTFVNGRPLVGPHMLTTGDVVDLGEAVTVTFQTGESAAINALSEEPVARPRSATSPPARRQGPARRLMSGEDQAPSPPPNRDPSVAARSQPRRNQAWLWIGAGCVVLLLIAACAAVLILAYLELLPGILYEMLRRLSSV